MPAHANSMKVPDSMKVRASTDAEGLKRMTVRDIRDTFVIEDLFRPGEVTMTYVEVDRAVIHQLLAGEPE